MAVNVHADTAREIRLCVSSYFSAGVGRGDMSTSMAMRLVIFAYVVPPILVCFPGVVGSGMGGCSRPWRCGL